ncbi:MAG: hypothetical protein KDC12_13025, partial [Flavobacteriales bacterium]|nr:hypothetical protein [Flavobacteriales bacterium]
DYLAYHLNQFEADRYVVDLSSNIRVDFLNRQLLGMENNGNTARFRANDRFDGLLFLGRSGVPQLTD